MQVTACAKAGECDSQGLARSLTWLEFPGPRREAGAQGKVCSGPGQSELDFTFLSVAVFPIRI